MMDKSYVKILAVDDDSDFLDLLLHYLSKIGIKKTATSTSFSKANQLLDSFVPDIVLLDIDLGGEKNGVDLGLLVRQTLPEAIIIYFTNNFTDSFFEAVKPVRPNAFLDKHLDELKVRQAIELALEAEYRSITTLPKMQPSCFFTKEFVFIKVGAAFKKIELEEIDYIFYADRYANIQLGGKSYPLNMTMKDLGQNLSTHVFIQINQSYIVNMRKITQISTLNNQVEIVGKWLPIGVSFRKRIQEQLVFLT